MKKEDYLDDPCRAASLPFWKSEQIQIPAGILIYREDEFSEENLSGKDERYFKLLHDLETVPETDLPDTYMPDSAGLEEIAEHIRECYVSVSMTAAELKMYQERTVFDPDLWIVVREKSSGKIAACVIGELDRRIGEGVVEWVQVSPGHRRKGLGRFIVCELLRRLRGKADFVTVSGRLDSPDHPYELYRSCGFAHPVIWHIVSVPEEDSQLRL